MGYHQAGFEVIGVDIEPQPHYPFEFHQGDALEYIRDHGHEFDAIHASPPCQASSSLRHRWAKEYTNLIPQTRAVLKSANIPYVIENVEGAALVDPLTLCGTMFGLRVIRHRLFETCPPIYFPPASCHCRGLVGRRGCLADREYMTVTGHFSNIGKARLAMGIDWMTQAELAQAIPPAYTKYIGEHILAHLQRSPEPIQLLS